MNQKKKIAIITGSSQGLGAAIAIKLSEKGINVVINYSSNEKLAQETMKQCINKFVGGANNASLKGKIGETIIEEIIENCDNI